MKNALFGILLIVFLFLAGRDAYAQCDCAGYRSEDIRGSRYKTALEELKNSDAVFYGQVIEMKMIPRRRVEAGGDDYEVEIKFHVVKAWHTDLSEFVTIREYSQGCLIGFSIASRWLVYVRRDQDNNFRTSYCSRTRVAYRNPEKDFKEFEENGEKQSKILKVSVLK